MTNLQAKLKNTNYKDINSLELTECDYICLSYMINIKRYLNHTPFSINELYSIISRIQNNNKKIQNFYSKIKPIEESVDTMIDSIEKKIWKIKMEY